MSEPLGQPFADVSSAATTEFGDEREVESNVVLTYHFESGRLNLLLKLSPGHAVDMAKIVDRLADWGWRPSAVGKIVWAKLSS